MTNLMRRNILSGVLSVVSGKVLTLFVSLATMPLLYRFLGPAKFGEYTTVMSVHALFMIFVSSGVTNGVRKFVAEDRHVPNWEGNVAGFYFRMAVLLAGVGALVYHGAVRSGLVSRFLSPVFEEYFTLMIGMVVAAQLWAYARRSLMGFGLERYSEPLQVLYNVSFAVVALLLVYSGYGVLGALAGQIVGTTIVAIIGLGLVLQRVSLRSMILPGRAELPRQRMVTYNTMAVGLAVFQMSLYHVDVIMLQSLAGSTEVGNYKTALMLAEFLWFVPMTLQTVYVHSTSELWSRDRYDRIADLASRTTRYTLLLTTVMALGLASLAHVVVPLYWGSAALPAITPLLVLLPGALGFAAVRPTIAIEEGNGTLRYAVIATGAAAVINVSLNVLLIPRFGMTGAAAATSVGYGSMLLFHIWSARKLQFDPVADARLVRIALTALLAAGPILLLPRVLPGDLVALVVVPAMGLAVFLLVAFVTGALELRECIDLLSAFPDPIGSTVDSIDNRLQWFRMSDLLPNGGQFWLMLVGLLLFASGTGIAVVDIAADGDSGMPAATNSTETPTEAVELTPASTDGSGTESTSTPTTESTDTESDGGGGGPVPSETATEATATDTGSTATVTENETSTETETTTETETETSTETETTDTETPTETETVIDTETETSTHTGTENESATPTETATETETQTITEPATENDSETTTTEQNTSTTETETDGILLTSAETETTATETTTSENTTTTSGTPTSTSGDGLFTSISLRNFASLSAFTSVALGGAILRRTTHTGRL